MISPCKHPESACTSFSKNKPSKSLSTNKHFKVTQKCIINQNVQNLNIHVRAIHLRDLLLEKNELSGVVILRVMSFCALQLLLTCDVMKSKTEYEHYAFWLCLTRQTHIKVKMRSIPQLHIFSTFMDLIVACNLPDIYVFTNLESSWGNYLLQAEAKIGI